MSSLGSFLKAAAKPVLQQAASEAVTRATGGIFSRRNTLENIAGQVARGLIYNGISRNAVIQVTGQAVNDILRQTMRTGVGSEILQGVISRTLVAALNRSNRLPANTFFEYRDRISPTARINKSANFDQIKVISFP